MKSFFTSEQGKHELFRLYDAKLTDINAEIESLDVETSFGKTHILTTGEPQKPPLIIVHGSNACAPIALETYPRLAEKFRVFAVDVIAQPNKSEGERFSMKDHSYGKWMNEVMNELNLTNVTLAGFSFGGLIILKTLEFDASRVKEVFLAAPAYIVNGNPLKLIFHMFIPMKRYMRTKKIDYVKQFLSKIFTEPDQFALNFLSKVFLHFEMDFDPVPVIKTKHANNITTPVTLFPAKHDLLFPGKRMAKRATKIFPSLKKCVLLLNSKHVQNRADNTLIEQHILDSV